MRIDQVETIKPTTETPAKIPQRVNNPEKWKRREDRTGQVTAKEDTRRVRLLNFPARLTPAARYSSSSFQKTVPETSRKKSHNQTDVENIRKLSGVGRRLINKNPE